MTAATRYLRALREGLMCFRRKLDTTEALVEEARRRAARRASGSGVDLASNAIVEAFGNDLELVRTPPDEARASGAVEPATGGRERVAFPSIVFAAADGSRHGVFGANPYERYRDAAQAAGRAAGAAPGHRRRAAALRPHGTGRGRGRSAACRARARTPSSGGWPRSGRSSRCPCSPAHLWELA